MYTIMLTRGAGWDAPVIATHVVEAAKHIVDVERLALRMIAGTRQVSNAERATDYRIFNEIGHCVRSSTTAGASSKRTWHAGRTCWGEARSLHG